MYTPLITSTFSATTLAPHTVTERTRGRPRRTGYSDAVEYAWKSYNPFNPSIQPTLQQKANQVQNITKIENI